MNFAIRHVALAAAGILGLSTQALAVTKATTIVGTLSSTQETCLQGLTNAVGDGENCMYNGGPAADPTLNPILGFGEVTGPYNHIAFYDSVATPASFQTTISGSARLVYASVDGDGKMSQNITGSLTIDDNGNGFGAGDLISGTFTMTSSGAGSIVRVQGGSSVVDRYDSMTQVLAATAASSATANGFGGFDYVIGNGFPTLLTYSQAGACFGLAFGHVECGHSFTANATSGIIDPDFWNGTSVAGLGSLEGNLGAKTSGTLVNLACVDGRSSAGVESNDCHDSQTSFAPWVIGPNANLGGGSGCQTCGGPNERGTAEDVSWDGLVLKVSTNAVGAVVAVAGFDIEDYRVFGAQRCGDNTTGTGSYAAVCNSWSTGYLTAQSPDSDGDGDQDSLDNCRSTSNATQLDSNGDGYGNICDADLNNSGLTTSTDFNLLRSVLNQSAGSSALAAAADMNGSGLVTSTDFNLLRARLNTAPGPSGFH